MENTASDFLTAPPARAFEILAQTPDEDIPLLAAALQIARDEYPQLDVAHFEAQAEDFARRARELGASAAEPLAAMRVLNNLLFDELGFSGNVADYYDPRNSYLNDVFERRLGIPISLAVVQLDVARRLGLPLEGVSFPGHFLVRLPVDGGLLVLDPFHKGRSLDAEELKQRAKPHLGNAEIKDEQLSTLLAPAGNRMILVRMLRNLKSLYSEKEDFERALRCADRLLKLDSDQPTELRDRGLLYLRVGHNQAGAADLRAYLSANTEVDDAEKIRRLLIEASTKPARLN
jgi:regulator of sirC expression with transglutaminase-like and TPR domain